MNILPRLGTSRELSRLLDEEAVIGDYVYMYPPRQTYRSFGTADVLPLIVSSLERSDSLNLYVHFPFCRQTCAFCNLFTVVSRDESLFETYTACLERETAYYGRWIQGKRIGTVYIGGGTPSLLPTRLLARLLRYLQDCIGFDISRVDEVSLEVSPETVDYEKLCALRDLGINRVNIGMQSAADEELHLIGRRYGSSTPLRALEIAQGVGFRNVCVDLIYGLQGQTFDSWRASLEAVLRFGPDTVCAYPLTLRPVTGFSEKGYRFVSAQDQYTKYDYARARLTADGYHQETHVRYVKNQRGGYLQKSNHWSLQNVLGLGAGARSYLWHCDYRNGYGARNRMRVLNRYMENVRSLGHGREDGFVMDEDERRRKAVILGLIDLNRAWFGKLFGADPVEVFPLELGIFSELGLLEQQGEHFRLASRGVRHRDVLVQALFSERVRALVKDFDYGSDAYSVGIPRST